MTTTLRQRIPFVSSADDDGDDREVLHDEEQEEIIEDLRARNVQTSARTLLVVDAVLALSAFLQLFTIVVPPASSPPCPRLFSLLGLAIHLNLALLLHPLPSAPTPLPYTLLYALGCVAPTLSLFLGRDWPAILWAAVPTLIVFLTHSVHSTLQEGDAALAELESLKYRAPGP
ncbi:hypothetical protein FB45DRAFT_897092 [Roridomyces roridus]|uniref:Uncharacterized protein n=1 Tax=Roridomyces roridus TaxID=1738132 RepID=A0AAD7FXX7_9AGAR|nr:hypothetical protein FB45DRAFT_897092 [Roridomyces roridus]